MRDLHCVQTAMRRCCQLLQSLCCVCSSFPAAALIIKLHIAASPFNDVNFSLASCRLLLACREASDRPSAVRQVSGLTRAGPDICMKLFCSDRDQKMQKECIVSECTIDNHPGYCTLLDRNAPRGPMPASLISAVVMRLNYSTGKHHMHLFDLGHCLVWNLVCQVRLGTVQRAGTLGRAMPAY